MKLSLARAACAFLVVLLSACTAITKVEGEQSVGTRLTVQLPDAWNKVGSPLNYQPYELWTQEGVGLDQLRFWTAVKPQQYLVSRPPAAAQGGEQVKVPTFAANMRLDQLVGLFENVYSMDGSLVSVTRVAPASFGGQPGVHFEFTQTRKADDVVLLGTGWAAVQGGELFAMVFTAPRLTFHPRQRPQIDRLAASARIR